MKKQKQKPGFIVGKLYRRIPSPNASHTTLTNEMNGDKIVGSIKLGSTFILLQKEGVEPLNSWYKVMTSDGIVGWSTLYFYYWEQVDS